MIFFNNNFSINLDAPNAWGVYFQDSASPQMEGLVELHDNIMYYLVVILFAVGWILLSIVRNYVETKSPISHKYLNHGTLIELIWTITPAIILILIAFPSYKLLYLMDEVSDPSMSVLVEGHEWYWGYQTPDLYSSEISLSSDYIYLSGNSGTDYDPIRNIVSQGNTTNSSAPDVPGIPTPEQDKRMVIEILVRQNLIKPGGGGSIYADNIGEGANFDTRDKREALNRVYIASKGTHYTVGVKSKIDPEPKLYNITASNAWNPPTVGYKLLSEIMNKDTEAIKKEINNLRTSQNNSSF